jgi:hypothetical protein
MMLPVPLSYPLETAGRALRVPKSLPFVFVGAVKREEMPVAFFSLRENLLCAPENTYRSSERRVAIQSIKLYGKLEDGGNYLRS